MKTMTFLSYAMLLFLISNCQPPQNQEQTNLIPNHDQLKAYWYNGEAELCSYQLTQARYGELREGTSVLIYVTEDFSTKTMTKADQPADENISVLKLNNTRKFQTGIYPYSMLTSSFFPFPDGERSIKVSTSSQEWCGHTYLELQEANTQFEIDNHSYFQSESVKELAIPKDLLEDDLWTMIRLNPEGLPIGTQEVIPSFFFLRFTHSEIRAYDAELTLSEKQDGSTLYTVHYPKLDRTLTITFESEFPHIIQKWEETYFSGWGESRKKLTTTGTLMKTMRSKYWQQNAVADSISRKKLGLR